MSFDTIMEEKEAWVPGYYLGSAVKLILDVECPEQIEEAIELLQKYLQWFRKP